MTIASLAVSTNFVMQLSGFLGQVEDVALNNAIQKTKEREGLIKSFLDHSKDTILALRSSSSFQKFLDDNASIDLFENLALDIAKSDRDIMSIRFLELTGKEKVRIYRKRLGSTPVVAPSHELQNKSHRYYFKHALNVPMETIWFSKLDLNQEYSKVERPHKETLRILIPVSHKGKRIGIIVVNYYMVNLLKELFSVPLYNMILADSNGDILIHYNKEKSWSHYNNTAGLQAEVTQYKNMLENETYLGGGFFSRQLKLPLENQLILVLSLNQDYVSQQKTRFIKNGLYSGTTTILITLIFGAVLIILFKRFFNEHEVRAKKIHSLEELNHQMNILLDKNKAYMDMATDGVHIMKPNGDIVAFSQSFASMLGYTEEELLELNSRDWITPSCEAQVEKKLSSMVDKATKIECKHRCKDGSTIDVEVNAKWIVVDEEKLLYASSRDVTQRNKMVKELERLATTDFLTQLPSRRLFDERLSDELERYRRSENYKVTIAMLDIDYFKDINDSYGHTAGDMALKHVAEIIHGELTRLDFVARFGGDEFGIILTNSDEVTSVNNLERIRLKLKQYPLIIEGKPMTISISVGATLIMSDQKEANSVLKKADKALYRAKELGRGRVEFFRSNH